MKLIRGEFKEKLDLMFAPSIKAGFPNSADDYMHESLDFNRDIIKHPAHVRPGQYIRIPDLTEEYRNLYNPELRQLVDSLAVEYLAPSSH
jgi:DNA polymerase V